MYITVFRGTSHDCSSNDFLFLLRVLHLLESHGFGTTCCFGYWLFTLKHYGIIFAEVIRSGINGIDKGPNGSQVGSLGLF